eukprot:m.853582 g.853582  ORF g.853582 m.853582 type:complete len:82 (-) comp59611_c0_seq1:18-263(-)
MRSLRPERPRCLFAAAECLCAWRTDSRVLRHSIPFYKMNETAFTPNPVVNVLNFATRGLKETVNQRQVTSERQEDCSFALP